MNVIAYNFKDMILHNFNGKILYDCKDKLLQNFSGVIVYNYDILVIDSISSFRNPFYYYLILVV